jgi:hypothetical protein
MATREDGKVDCGPIDLYDAVKGLGHIVSYMLINWAGREMDEDGNSSLLNTLIADVSSQDEECIPEAGKRYALGLVAAVEYSLRELAQQRKNGRTKDAE